MHFVQIVLGIQSCIIQAQSSVRNDSHLHRAVLRHVYLVPVHLVCIVIIEVAQMAGGVGVIDKVLGILPCVVRFLVILITGRHGLEGIRNSKRPATTIPLHLDIICACCAVGHGKFTCRPHIAARMHLVLAVLGIQIGVVQAQVAAGRHLDGHVAILGHHNLKPLHGDIFRQ